MTNKTLLCSRRLHSYLCLRLARHSKKAVVFAIHCNICQCTGGGAVTCFTHNVCGSHFLKLTFTKCPCLLRWHTLPSCLQSLLVCIHMCETVVGVIAKQVLRYTKHFSSWTKESLNIFCLYSCSIPQAACVDRCTGWRSSGRFCTFLGNTPPLLFSRNEWLTVI